MRKFMYYFLETLIVFIMFEFVASMFAAAFGVITGLLFLKNLLASISGILVLAVAMMYFDEL